MKKYILGLMLFYVLAIVGAGVTVSVQSLAQGNPTCPTRPVGDSSNACASTAFVQGSANTLKPNMTTNVVCGTADDTASMQHAMDTWGVIILPSSPFIICKATSLNLTNRQSPSIIGAGPLLSQIQCIQSGVNCIDRTGSYSSLIQDVWITTAPGIAPKVGILDAQPPCCASLPSDTVQNLNVRVDGTYSVATWFIASVASSKSMDGVYYNSYPGGSTVVMTGSNVGWGVTSAFTPITTTSNQMPSDWTFVSTEMHNLGGGFGFYCGGCSSVRFIGGNIAANNTPAPVSINAVVNFSGATIYPRLNYILGTTIYNDIPPAPPCGIQNNGDAESEPYISPGSYIPEAAIVCPTFSTGIQIKTSTVQPAGGLAVTEAYRTITATAPITVTNGDGVAAAPAFSVSDGAITNAKLANPATTVNSQTCTLGSTCTVTAAPSGSAGGDLTGTYPNPTLAGIITAGGPTGSATVSPIITYDAKGRLTTVTSATVTPAIGSVTGLGSGVSTVLGNTAGGAGGFALFNSSGVSCSAGTVNLTTLVVTSGIVTHC